MKKTLLLASVILLLFAQLETLVVEPAQGTVSTYVRETSEIMFGDRPGRHVGQTNSQ